MKEGLAKSLVVKYPQFQKLVLVPEQTPWVRFLLSEIFELFLANDNKSLIIFLYLYTISHT